LGAGGDLDLAILATIFHQKTNKSHTTASKGTHMEPKVGKKGTKKLMQKTMPKKRRT